MINFSIKDAFDIFLVALLLYYIYRLMKRSSGATIFSGIIVFIIVWIIFSQILNFKLMGTMLNYVINVGALALVVLFQEEIRHFLFSLGSHHSASAFVKLFLGSKDNQSTHEDVLPIVMACMNMAKGKVGALIVVERNVPLDNIVRTGDTIDANINQRLIENIFFKNSPLHDGAMVISHKRIKAAGCILPVAHNLDIPKELGLRHRAGMGISQETDAVAIIVSEETGGISVAKKGEFFLRLNAEELERLLTSED